MDVSPQGLGHPAAPPLVPSLTDIAFNAFMRQKPWLSSKNIQRRRQWARDNVGRDWRSVIFTDESSIELGGKVGSQRTSRRAGEAYIPKHIQPTFQSSWYGAQLHTAPSLHQQLEWSSENEGRRAERPEVHRYDPEGTLGGRNGAVQQLRREGWRDVLVVEDGARAHKSRIAQEARRSLGISNLDHPAASPDLNPIENIWWILKSRVANITPWATTLDHLWAHIQDVEELDASSSKEDLYVGADDDGEDGSDDFFGSRLNVEELRPDFSGVSVLESRLVPYA